MPSSIFLVFRSTLAVNVFPQSIQERSISIAVAVLVLNVSSLTLFYEEWYISVRCEYEAGKCEHQEPVQEYS